MRAIAIGTAVFLLAVATASGSHAETHGAGVTQKAIEAPLPSGAARKKGSGLSQVRCLLRGCIATGSYGRAKGHLLALGEIRGKWAAQKTPAGVGVLSLACPSIGKCVGTSGVGEQRTQILSQKGLAWQAADVTLPADAPETPWPDLASVACVKAVDYCAAVGSYQNGFAKPLVVTESGGTWSAGTQPQLPAKAATTRDPNIPTVGNPLSLVACPSVGSCTAVGTYTADDAAAGEYPWVLDETAGQWGRGASAQLPADAKAQGESERGGSAPFFGFTGLSCPSAGNCTAVGGYWGRVDAEQGLTLTQRNGAWSRGITAPLPPRAVPNNEPNEFNAPLTSVSCAAPDDCAAVGWYVLKRGGTHHGLLLTERGGTWKASALGLPAGVNAPGGVFLSSVTCRSRGNCLAVGFYASHGKTYGLIVRERGGKWGRGITAALPSNAASAGKSHTFLNSVSCAPATRCTAVGTYVDRSGVDQGLIVRLRLG